MHYDYAPASAAMIARVAAIETIAQDFGVTLPAAALAFVLAHPAVASVIPGMGSARRVTQTLALHAAPIPTQFWTALREAGLIRPDAPVPGDTMTIDAIRLSPDDNVVVTCRAVDQGTTILVDGVALTLAQTVPIGHKLAFTAIGAGARVIKYGMPIGSMTEAVQPGDWVHMHNMQSDYMPAHLRDATGGTAGEPA
jgi:D-threo-aldose 1-dehydrogenase